MFEQNLFTQNAVKHITNFTPDIFCIKNIDEGDFMLVDRQYPDKTLNFNDDSAYTVHENGNIFQNKSTNIEKFLILSLNYSEKFMSRAEYVGTNSLISIDHDLRTTPELVMFKNTSSPSDWIVWHYSFSDKGYLKLNSDEAFVNDKLIFGKKIHNKIKFYADKTLSIKNDNYVVYGFAFSKYFCSGFYTGKAQNFIKTKNKPDLVIIKRVDQIGSWRLFSRLFGAGDSLRLNSFGKLTENDDLLKIEFAEDGFYINESSYALNDTNGQYIYMCFSRAD